MIYNEWGFPVEHKGILHDLALFYKPIMEGCKRFLQNFR